MFNLGADIYAWFTAQRAWRESCLRLAEEVAGARCVVDMGCGPGVSTFELAQLLPGSSLIGVDVAPRMLLIAQRRSVNERIPSQRRITGNGRITATPRITWMQADAVHLPLRAASVDACTGHSFLYLVADRAAVLAEVRRILKPGGRLALMEPNARAITPAQALAVSHDPRHLVSVSLWRPFSRLHGRFSVDSLGATLATAGFVDCHAQETLGGLGVLARATNP